MIGELSVSSEWIPDRWSLGPFSSSKMPAKSARRTIPIGLCCPVRLADNWVLVTRKQSGTVAGHLRIRALLGPVIHPRRADHAAQPN